MSHRSRWEYFRAIYARYRPADRKLNQVILNEFCANTRYNRKYAIRLLNGPPPSRFQPQRARRRALAELRAGRAVGASGGVGSGRLSLVGAFERPAAALDAVGEEALAGERAEVEQQLLAISARQVDRRLRERPYGKMLGAGKSARIKVAARVLFERDSEGIAIEFATLSDVAGDRTKTRNEQNFYAFHHRRVSHVYLMSQPRTRGHHRLTLRQYSS